MAIPTKIERSLENSGVIREMAIDLSDSIEDRAMIIEVLRSKLYSDKILAPIREYSTNGFDSHTEAGKFGRPLRIVLPTILEPTFSIRDYGIGLNPEEIERIYIKYGRSTKRGTNAQTGQLGLGCKSAFAYGDNFMIVSFKDGVKTTYNLTISGVCSILASEAMEPGEENGIQVIIPVQDSDINEFQTKAINFFKYWKVCPEIVGGDIGRLEKLRAELAVAPIFAGDSWELRPAENYYSYRENGVAVMGNIPYPLNWDIITSKVKFNETDSELFDFIRANKTLLRFDIGELDFSASRESLEYTEKTCLAVQSKVRDILNSVLTIVNDKIATASSYWEAIGIYSQIFGNTDERLFQGNMSRLQSSCKGKLFWNKIPIETGTIGNMHEWDILLGYAKDGAFVTTDPTTGKTFSTRGDNPVLVTYGNTSGRIKEYLPSTYSANFIPTSKKGMVLIHDLEKPTLGKMAVRYLFAKNSNITKIYLLRFKNDAQKTEFYDKTNFHSVPVTKVSDIQDKVKEWRKANSVVSSGSTPLVKESQSVRCVSMSSRMQRGYFQDLSWQYDEVDLHSLEGLYVGLSSNEPMLGNRSVGLAALSHHLHAVTTAAGDTEFSVVYGFPDRNVNAKWFQAKVLAGTMVQAADHVQSLVDKVVRKEGKALFNAVMYRRAKTDGAIVFGAEFCKTVKQNISRGTVNPVLKGEDHSLFMKAISMSECADVNRLLSIVDSFAFFGVNFDNEMEEYIKQNPDDVVDFVKLASDVKNKYPLFTALEHYQFMLDGKRGYFEVEHFLNQVVGYVNLADMMPTIPSVAVSTEVVGIEESVAA